jgi:malate synthase
MKMVNMPKMIDIASHPAGTERVLTSEALALIEQLHTRFEPTRRQLLQARVQRQAKIDQGEMPAFLAETRSVRESAWKVAPAPKDLLDRRVEITGPVDRKMIINALNSGAKVFMADFEDSHSPTWSGTIEGQVNLQDAVRRAISFESPEGKKYALSPNPAVLIVRPRGWHLVEKHLKVGGEPVSASIFDFALYFLHNARELLNRGSGPYFYLPKMESHLEARLWNEVFVAAQKHVGLPVGTIRATVLIETILASFEMDEILFELKDHIVGLNCGRWDYIFSYIKKFRKNPDLVLPDRAAVTMTTHFLTSYVKLLIRTCHRRGAHAMGGMAAQIPIKNDQAANDAAVEKVRADKKREVTLGHDGTWVAHPGLVPIAMQIFNEGMKGPNQLARVDSGEAGITAADLLRAPEGEITEKGLRTNVNVALLYIESWLNGVGCVPLYHLMEDAATAEISRAQIWQWIRQPKGKFADGRKVTLEMFKTVLKEELSHIRDAGGQGKYPSLDLAAQLLDQIVSSEEFAEFLTLPAYERLP